MTDKRCQVPEAMLERAKKDGLNGSREFDLGFMAGMEFACEDLSEHPIVPTDEQLEQFRRMFPNADIAALCAFADWWQRRMFLAEPEVPEEAFEQAQMLYTEIIHAKQDAAIERIARGFEAYRRGQQAKG